MHWLWGELSCSFTKSFWLGYDVRAMAEEAEYVDRPTDRNAHTTN
jgi:hypothetical protein